MFQDRRIINKFSVVNFSEFNLQISSNWNSHILQSWCEPDQTLKQHYFETGFANQILDLIATVSRITKTQTHNC